MDGGLVPFVTGVVFSSGVLFFAAKIMDVELKFSGAVIVILGSSAAVTIPGGAGTVISLLVHFGLLKLFTKASIFKLIILNIISVVISVLIYKVIIIPMLIDSVNSIFS